MAPSRSQNTNLATSQNLSSPLLTLPTEIRQQIFKLTIPAVSVLVSLSASEHEDAPATAGPLTHQLHRADTAQGVLRLNLGLILTCKGVRDEALSLLYSRTRFFFTTAGAVVRFAEVCRQANLDQIRSVVFVRTFRMAFPDKVIRTQQGYLAIFSIKHTSELKHRELAWGQACETVGTHFSGLQQFGLHAHFKGRRGLFADNSIERCWWRTTRKSLPSPMHFVEVVLTSDVYTANHQDTLRHRAQQMADELMTQGGTGKLNVGRKDGLVTSYEMIRSRKDCTPLAREIKSYHGHWRTARMTRSRRTPCW